MASAKCLVPMDNFKSKFYSDSAGGTRARFVLGSIAAPPSDDVVPRRAIDLTDEDKRVLSNLALPPDRWTDLEVIIARQKQDKRVSVDIQEISQPGHELSCEFVLKKLGEFMRSSADKDGAVIHYFGNGRKLRGDWCFKDGYITFKDLMDVYMENYRGHILTVISDCSYSGKWVKDCYEFLDEQGVGPCGHCAIEKGVLLKVYASCTPNQRASTLAFSLRGVFLDKNTGTIRLRTEYYKIAEQQNGFGRDFTTMLCGKNADEECALDATTTWKIQQEGNRVYRVRGEDRGRSAWFYVLLVDDEDTITAFKEALKEDTIDLENYGQILESGFGEEPPNEVTDRIQKKYHIKK